MTDIGTIAAYLVFAFCGFALVVFGIAEWYLFIRPEWRARATSRLIPPPSPVMAVAVTLLGFAILGILAFSLFAKGVW